MDIKKVRETVWERVKLKPLSVLLVFILIMITTLITISPFLQTTEEKTIAPINKVIIAGVILLALIGFAIYLAVVIKHNTFPSIKTGHIGVLILIQTESKKMYDDTKYRFSKYFDDCMKDYPLFSVSYVPFHLREKINMKERASIIKYLQKTNTIYLIEIIVITDEPEQATQYQISVNQGVLHPNYNEDINSKLNNELARVSDGLRNVKFVKAEKLDKINSMAEYLMLICSYIVGLTHFLNRETRGVAVAIHDNLFVKVKAIKKNDSTINELKRILPGRCYTNHMAMAMDFYNEYFYTKKDVLANFSSELERANQYIPNTYDYFLMKANYHVFAKEYVQAKESVQSCKRTNPHNKTWLYCDAYLTAYEGPKFLSIYNKYKRAFSEDYPLQQLIIYIEDVLEDEPERASLLFALGILYNQIKDMESVRKVFKEFYGKFDYSNLDANTNKIILDMVEITYSELMISD